MRLLNSKSKSLLVLFVLLTFSQSALAELFAAVLPSSRSVQVNQYASFFATVINAGSEDLTNCRASVNNGVPGTFWYRPASPGNNFPVGERSTAADIAAGEAQPFYLEFRSSAVLLPSEVAFDFECDGSAAAPVAPGVNTLLFSASSQRPPDIIALTATLTGDGIVNLPVDGSQAFFAAATSNVGATGNLTVSAVGTGVASAVQLSVCETNPETGACRGFAGPEIALRIDARERNTFTVFLRTAGNIPFDPANNRVSLQFADSAGQVRGSTSIAVRSADLTIGGTPTTRLLAGDSYLFTPVVGRRPGRTVEYSLSNQPDWLSVSDSGVLTGIPGDLDVGNYTDLILSVSDGLNRVELPPFSIEVIASSWRAGPSMPYETWRHATATLEDRLFYFGGRRSNDTSGAGPTSVREYDQSVNSWIARSAMPLGVQLGNAHGINGIVHVFGGFGTGNGQATNTVQLYSPLTDSWSQTDMPVSRYGYASAEVDGFVYIIGGVRTNVTGDNLSNQLDIYNSADGSWITGPPVPIRCDGAGAAAIGDIIYLTGGCSNSAEVHAFDTSTGTWSQTTSLPAPLAYHRSVALDGKLYVLGGYRDDGDGGSDRTEVHVFDPATSEWQQVQSMRTARSAFGATVLNGEIWVSGGIRVDSVEIYSVN